MRLDRAVDATCGTSPIERGLSDHTVAAYRRDLAGYVWWLEAHGVSKDSGEVTGGARHRVRGQRASAGPHRRGIAAWRACCPSVRGLHRFLAREGIEPRTTRPGG